jgi:hypothetical protein
VICIFGLTDCEEDAIDIEETGPRLEFELLNEQLVIWRRTMAERAQVINFEFFNIYSPLVDKNLDIAALRCGYILNYYFAYFAMM